MTVRAVASIVAVALLTGCGGGGSSTPAAPSAAAAVVLSGVVFNQALGPQATVSSARVAVTAGVNVGRFVTSDSAGRYRLDALGPGAITLEISAAGFVTSTRSFTLSADQVADVGLAPNVTTTNGRVVDALSQAGVGGIAISGDAIAPAVSDPSGAFVIGSSLGTGDPLAALFTGASVVERRTAVRVPGRDATVSVIPATFDLHAFDEMFRTPQLRRWTAAPPLVVETRTARFVSADEDTATAIDEQMSESDYTSIVDDLTWALPQLTGGVFTHFASVTRQTTSPGASVTLLTPGVITVMREVGMEAASGAIGYGRWHYESDGTVTGGSVRLDRDYDRTGGYRRSLRSHELGHALGYDHVSVQRSVMNPTVGYEPTPFDRDGSTIAFQRVPGNRSPDSDPTGYSPNRLGLPAVWSPPIR